jgi:hypothetical protein
MRYQVIIELLISFILITIGCTMEYLKFDEIFIDKQNPEKLDSLNIERLFSMLGI